MAATEIKGARGAPRPNAGLAGISSCCKECGMPGVAGEYHPYAACLMFKGCRDSTVVRANLDAVVAHGYQLAVERQTD